MTESIFGLSGVLVGSSISWIKDALLKQRLRRQHATYLAARVVCVLDEYAQKCVDVVQDDGRWVREPSDQNETLAPQVERPEPLNYPDDVDWKSIDGELMYRLLALPNKARDADRYIEASTEHAYLPDYEEFFEARQQGYGELGMEAMNLAEKLREAYGIPQMDHGRWNQGWDPKAYLGAKQSDIEKRQQNRTDHYLSLPNERNRTDARPSAAENTSGGSS